MEITDSNFIENDSSTFDALAKSYVLSTAKWARFLSIAGFVFIGIIVVLAFSFGTIFSTFSEFSPQMGQMGGMMGVVFAIVYLLIAFLYFFPTWYLFRFSKEAISAIENNSQSLASAFKNLNSCFKFWGIMLIIVLGFYGLMIIGFVLMAMGK